MPLRKLDISTAKIEWNETLKENEKILKQEEADLNRTALEVNNEINDLQVNNYSCILFLLLIYLPLFSEQCD